MPTTQIHVVIQRIMFSYNYNYINIIIYSRNHTNY